MSRTYSSFVLICVVTQALPDVPEGLCQREIRKYHQVTKISSKLCATKMKFCPAIQFSYCSYHIRYYKCTYLQHLKAAKVKLTYTCCDGYYAKNGYCEKDPVNTTTGVTCNTCLCNDTCANDTASVTGTLPVPTEAANKNEERHELISDYDKRWTEYENEELDALSEWIKRIRATLKSGLRHVKAKMETVNAIFGFTCSTCRCNYSCQTDTNSVIGSISVPIKAKHTQGGLKLILIIAIVILAVLTLIVQAALWIQQYQSETRSERLTELQPSRNTLGDRNEAFEEDDAHFYEL